MKNKIKSRKSVLKRFKFTKKGKVLRRGQGARHLKFNKSKKRLRSIKQMKSVHGVFKKKIKRMAAK